MKLQINFRIIGLVIAIFFFLIGEIAEAQNPAAVTHRRTRRRTAVVVSSATHAKDEQAAEAAQQQEAPPPTTEQEAPASTPASTTPEPESTSEPLPIGTVVSKLPEGCVSTPVDNVEYYHCGANYYRAVFQENTLVYVTTEPPK